MASSSLLHIEAAKALTPPPSHLTPPSSPCYRRQRAYTDSVLLNDLTPRDVGHTPHDVGHTPQEERSPPRGTAGYSSGYLSSCSNLHSYSPRVLIKPHPSRPLPSLPRHECEELPREYGNHQRDLSSDYYQENSSEIYSRLDRSNASILTSTPTQRARVPTHDQVWTPPTSPPRDRTAPRWLRQHSQDTNQFPFHATPIHSNVGTERKRNRHRMPLAQVMHRLEGVSGEVKRWLVKADQHFKCKEYAEAVPLLEGAIVKTQTYPRLQPILWELLGNAQMALGMCKKASVCHLQHLAHSRARDDFRGVTRAECNLGISYMQMGLLKLAGRCFLQYLKNCRSLQDECGIESACSNLGLLSKSLALKNYRAAMEKGQEELAVATLTSCLRRAVVFFKQHLEVVLTHGDVEKKGRAFGNLGSCYELLRDYPEAIFYHKQRLEVARSTGDMYSELCTLCNLGNCLRAKGNLEQALEYYEMDLEMAQSLGHQRMEELLQLNLGITYELLNQLEQAISCHTLYLGMVVRRGELKKQAEGFSTLARLYLETGQFTKAHEYYLNLIAVFRQLGNHTSLNSAQLQLKSLCQLMKQEKRKRRDSHTPSNKGSRRLRAHTLSRASNFHHEVSSSSFDSQGLGCRPRMLQGKMGTWSVGKRPRPQLNFVPSSSLIPGDLEPDPILVMADVPVSMLGHSGSSHGVGYGYPLQPASTRSRNRSCDMSHDQALHQQHTSSLDNSLESRSLSSHGSGEYDHLSPSPRNSTHTLNHTHSTESLYDYTTRDDNRTTPMLRGRYDYELVGSPEGSASFCSEDCLSSERSTTLPPLSYSSASLEGGRGISEEELTDEREHMQELTQAGLELARAGLELAGYEGLEGLEEGADKEWEQWQQIKAGVQGGSSVSVAGMQGGGNHHFLWKKIRTTASVPNL